jgi:hypothetical protein
MGEDKRKKKGNTLSRKQWIKGINNLAILVAMIVAAIRLFSNFSSGLSMGYALKGGIIVYLSIICSVLLLYIIVRFPKILLKLFGMIIGVAIILLVWRYGLPFIIGIWVGAIENPLPLIIGEPWEILLKAILFSVNPKYQTYGTIGGIIVSIFLIILPTVLSIISDIKDKNIVKPS